VTFTVYSNEDEGIERVWPFDLIPRIIPANEWATIEAGLKQRVRALNLFVRDLYHGQQILKDGVVPAEMVFNGKHFLREIMDIDPPQDIYVHISGIDLVRDGPGRYLVLEDNLRTPSGVSYMIENRIVERHILPEFFAKYRVRRVEHYPALLLEALRFMSPRGKDNAAIALLTPGIYNSAYFEHTFLAKEMGIELVEGRDLVTKNDVVYMKTTQGLQRGGRALPPRRRRLPRSALLPRRLGARGRRHHQRVARRQRRHRQRAGQRHRRRQGDLSVRARHHSLLPRRGADPAERPHLPDDEQRRSGVRARQPREMVVKEVSESGGYGMLMGPSSTPALRAEFATRIKGNPRNYIAQPVVPLSRHVCYLDGELESRHIDLRPFVIYGEDIQVVPGGLTRSRSPRARWW
jgi:uncharacterized circularly permuted ATP-grasp superfamily protein